MLVGRESELSLLAERIERRQAIAVLGEAGVGKTALVRAAAERAGKRLYEAGALATLSWLPYLPLRRAFGREFGDGDAVYVASEVERELGAALLFLDDLHWADAQTRSLLPLLAGRIPLVGAIRRGDPATAAALEAAAGAGLELVPLQPLAAAEAAELARRLHPDLSQAATERLVSRSGGNPFLLEELAATGEPSESLNLALAARLRMLSPEGRQAMALLCLAGRPLGRELLGSGSDELEAAGLATVSEEVATVRHTLLAETTIEQLAEEERRSLHSRLASCLADPGEAARHHAAAGERGAAHAKALEAAERAERLGERASHLRVAASCASGKEADALRLEAARLLLAAYDTAGVEAILDEIESQDALVSAQTWLMRMHLHWFARNEAEMVTALEAGIAAAAGTGSEVEVQLVVEAARKARWFGKDDELRLVEAEGALQLARDRGCHEAAAHYAVANARHDTGRPGSDEHFRQAATLARRDGDLAIEVSAANNLILYYLCSGELDRARAVAQESVARMREQRLVGLERRFRGWLAALDWHAGEPRRAAEEAESLLAGMVEPDDRRFLEFYLCQALTDVGRHQDAVRRARAMVREVDSPLPRLDATANEEAVEALWALTDAEFWSGRPRAALVTAEKCLAAFPGTAEGSTAFLHVTCAWARVELRLDPAASELDKVPPLAAAAPLELRALARLSAQAYLDASALFKEAGSLWSGRHFRGELRCVWATGEALRRAGKNAAAVESLLVAEERAAAHEYVPLLRWIHRSLRLAGEHRAATRSRDGALTGREREVLGLVADGLSNDEIAHRIGVGRPTVVRLIATASVKLGAKNRAQAAVLARR